MSNPAEPFLGVFRGRRVFLTGHTGFKGSWLALWLKQLGAQVTGYSTPPPTTPSNFDALGIHQQLNDLRGDIRDHAALTRALCQAQPEIVFHLAAQPLVRLSFEEPRQTYETNVIGTLNLYEAVRACSSVRAVVSITTDKCYENREWVWGYRETDPMGGYDPYSSSKGCAELLTASYRSSYFNPATWGKSHHVALASARAGNVIGGGDWAVDRLIPDCIRALTAAKPIILRNPGATRPWQHVFEPLAGYLWLGARLFTEGVAFAEGWNFGPQDGDVISVENMAREVCTAWGSGTWKAEGDASLHEARLLKLDISKAGALLGWRPVYSAAQAIRATVAWYARFNQQPQQMHDFSLSQIEAFTSAAAALGLPWVGTGKAGTP